MQEANAKLVEIADASEDKWDVAKKDIENFWEDVKTTVSDTIAKFKD